MAVSPGRVSCVSAWSDPLLQHPSGGSEGALILPEGQAASGKRLSARALGLAQSPRCPSGAATTVPSRRPRSPARIARRRSSPLPPPLVGLRTGDHAWTPEAAGPVATVHAPPRRGWAGGRPVKRGSSRVWRERVRRCPGDGFAGDRRVCGGDAAGGLGIAGMSRPRSAPQRRHENRLLVKATRVR